MIKIKNVSTAGWEPALRGMRNPMNSWDKADSIFGNEVNGGQLVRFDSPYIGPADHDLAMRLRNAGTDHRKYLRMIVCYADITAPLYWWKEFDTYRFGVEKNSCSTMHKIADKEFTLDDFSTDKMDKYDKILVDEVVFNLEAMREFYLNCDEGYKKEAWYQMIQFLPSSYNQKRTVMMSYEALANMYKARKNHKLDEWMDFCKWIEKLPYSELITGNEKDN